MIVEPILLLNGLGIEFSKQTDVDLGRSQQMWHQTMPNSAQRQEVDKEVAEFPSVEKEMKLISVTQIRLRKIERLRLKYRFNRTRRRKLC